MFWKRKPMEKSDASGPLPNFRYHPDPIATGMIERSDTECVCCKRKRGRVCTGPVYSAEEYDECICPWCIADGPAHRTLGVRFFDGAGRAGKKELEALGPDVPTTIHKATGEVDDESWEAVIEDLTRDGSTNAYLFRCLHCGKYGGYWDCD